MVSVSVSRMGKTGIVFVEPEPRLIANITVNNTKGYVGHNIIWEGQEFRMT